MQVCEFAYDGMNNRLPDVIAGDDPKSPTRCRCRQIRLGFIFIGHGFLMALSQSPSPVVNSAGLRSASSACRLGRIRQEVLPRNARGLRGV